MTAMVGINARIPNNLNEIITKIAKTANKSKSRVILNAIKMYVSELKEDLEDYDTAMQILSENNPTISWEDVKRECGLLEN